MHRKVLVGLSLFLSIALLIAGRGGMAQPPQGAGPAAQPVGGDRLMLDYRFSRSAALLVGYRFLDVDYEQGSGEDLFKFDVQFSGPEIGVAFFF